MLQWIRESVACESVRTLVELVVSAAVEALPGPAGVLLVVGLMLMFLGWVTRTARRRD